MKMDKSPGDVLVTWRLIIELAPGKFLKTSHTFIDSKSVNDSSIQAAIDEVRSAGAEVIVASEAYSVDNPENELMVQANAEFGKAECGKTALGGFSPESQEV